MLSRTKGLGRLTIGRDARWRGTRMLLGTVLLVSATLKAAGLLGANWGPVGLFRSPAMLLSAIELEFALSIWLLSGIAAPVCWMFTLLCFGGLAATAGYLLRTGAPTCGCLGPLRAPPVAMLVVDLFAIALLSRCRPPRLPGAPPRIGSHECPWLIHVSIIAGLSVTGMAAASYALLGQPSGVIGYLAGHRVYPSPRNAFVGECGGGELRKVTFDLANRGRQPVKIVGAASSYPLIALDGLPVTIPGSDTRPIVVNLHAPHRPEAFVYPIRLFTDVDGQREVAVFISGSVRADGDH